MTELDSYAPDATSSATGRPPSARPTIYRDTLLTNSTRRRVARPLPLGAHLEAPESERFSDGILLGLAALTLPAVVYSFAQLWSLLAGGSLQHAIRAFLP